MDSLLSVSKENNVDFGCAGGHCKASISPLRGGFTLIELLVYMAIMGFIIVVAGRVFSDSTSMRIRSQSMLQSSEEAGQVANILKEDISQMGTKTWAKKIAATTEASHEFIPAPRDVYMDYKDNKNDPSSDFSSFELKRNEQGPNFDQLMFRKVEYNDEGVFQGLRKITWWVNKDSILFRKCETMQTSGSISLCQTEDASEGVEMASGVEKFQFLASKPGINKEDLPSGTNCDRGIYCDAYMFPKTEAFNLIPRTNDPERYVDPTIASSGTVVTISGFHQNDISSNAAPKASQLCLAPAGNSDCKKFEFKKGGTYAISFDVPYESKMAMFQAGKEHLSVGLRDKDWKPIKDIPDFSFYPAPDNNTKDRNTKYFEFGVPRDEEDAYIAITAAFYGPAANGKLIISDFEVSKKLDKAFHFVDEKEPDYNTYTPDGKKKEFVKAFNLILSINKRGEKGETKITIPVPNNGVYVPVSGGP